MNRIDLFKRSRFDLLLFYCLNFVLFIDNNEACFAQSTVTKKIPVIVVTDLYQPCQDPGDNFDLITQFALHEIDLKAIILDCSEPFRRPIAYDAGKVLYPDRDGPRDPGFIPVCQLNYIFGRNVPVAAGPFSSMKNRDDKMLDVPAFQQQGIELILKNVK